MEFTFGLGQKSLEISSEILGGKGAGLVWLDANGIPVPPGFILPTTMWADYNKAPRTAMKKVAKLLPPYLSLLKEHFGYMPLLSVRSGARVSCPGMMDTILNVGLDAKSAEFWKEKLGMDAYNNSMHRLVTMYGSVVRGLSREELEKGDLIDALAVYSKETGEPFPEAKDQLLNSIEAVFKSWDNERANTYCNLNKIPHEWGTAVTVQAMVFGNLNDQSGTGVLFTRHPATGEVKVIGDFLIKAQGEDIVAGIRTPEPLGSMAKWDAKVHDELITMVLGIEKLRRDVQDIEFTIQDKKIYILQTRNAKRTAVAALKIAVDMATEGLISKAEAIKRVSARDVDMAQLPHMAPGFKKEPNFKGIAGGGGLVVGKPVFNSKDAEASTEPVILISNETTPEDVGGMHKAAGVLTMIGGFTSHAAVVCRGFNTPCITGLGQPMDVFKDAEFISMDGLTGNVWLEKVPIEAGEHNGLITEFKKMVLEVSGVIPVFYEVPKFPVESALLYLGDRMLNPEGAAKMVFEASKKVAKTLYVDFSTGGTKAEAEFFSIFEEWNPANQTLAKLVALEAVGGTSLKKLVVLNAPGAHSFNTLPVLGNLEALVLAEGTAVYAGESTPAVNKVLGWKKDSLELLSLNKFDPKLKSVLSVEQSLQLIAK